MIELLTPAQMGRADQLTIDAGTPGITLMHHAGDVLFQAMQDHFKNCSKVLILCGLGNNGGDGFVLADRLHQSGHDVDVTIIGDTAKIGGDARLALDQMPKYLLRTEAPQWDEYDLIVDGLFGAGLVRDITGEYAKVIGDVNAARAKVLAIDLPSGINGETGQISGYAVKADVTATFFRKKPGHILYPGQFHCGTTIVGQIGIADDVLRKISPNIFHNSPQLWTKALPAPDAMGHKYKRGHTLAISGPIEKSGAIRLAGQAALRIGSGLVTIAAPSDTLQAHAARSDALMLTPMNAPKQLTALLVDPRLTCVCMGPGLEPNEATRKMVLNALEHDIAVVLDAGALSAFSDKPDILHKAIRDRKFATVLTPHDGEFNRIFPERASETSKLEKAVQAAKTINATVLLKGPDTVISDCGTRNAISDNGTPWLATAGSGDVLTGAIAGLLAQGLSGFEAACAGAWFHGKASQITGPAMISSDLDTGLRAALTQYFNPTH